MLFDAIILNWILLINNTRHFCDGGELSHAHFCSLVRFYSHYISHSIFSIIHFVLARSLARSPVCLLCTVLSIFPFLCCCCVLHHFVERFLFSAKNNTFVSIFFILLSWTLVCITHRAYYSNDYPITLARSNYSLIFRIYISFFFCWLAGWLVGCLVSWVGLSWLGGIHIYTIYNNINVHSIPSSLSLVLKLAQATKKKIQPHTKTAHTQKCC